MSNLINEYISELEATKDIATTTKNLYINDLTLFKDAVNKDLKEVTKQDVLSFFSGLHGTIESSTIIKKKINIKAFYSWLEEQGKIEKNPFYKLKFKIKKTHKIYRILTTEEIKEMLVDGRTLLKISRSKSKTSFRRLRGQCVIRTLISTWIRRKELINLKIQDCHIKNRTLSILNTKTKRDRMVWFDKDTAIWLEIYLNRRKSYARGHNNMFINFEGEPLDEDKIDGIVNFRFWKAGIKGKFDGIKHGKGLGAHTFRRTGATHALRNGADIKTIQLLLGHTTIETTAKYLFPSNEDIKRSYDKTNILDNMKPNTEEQKLRKRKKRKKATIIKNTPKPLDPKFDEGLL